MNKKIFRKSIATGLCAVTMLTVNAPIAYANTNNKININEQLVLTASSPINVLNETIEEAEPINFTAQTTDNSCAIKFNKIGSYSVYQDGIQTLNSPDMKKLNKAHFTGELVDNYMFLGGEILSDYINIENLKPATTYHLYVFKSQEPIQNMLINEIDIVTKPEAIKVEENSKTSSSIKIKWNTANNAQKYEIYRDGNLIDTVNDNEFTDKKLNASTEYNYQVKAVYDNEELNKQSEFSNKLSVKTRLASSNPSTGTFSYRGVESGSMGLPAVSGNCKTWANYQAVTMKSSPQYKLLNADNCYTDPETGIRMVDDCYCVALGSYYGSKIGQKYLIKLSSGNEFKAILCDQKSDKHTDANHQYAVNNKDIIEFYIDRRYKPAAVDGSYGSLPQFAGSVVSIQKIV